MMHFATRCAFTRAELSQLKLKAGDLIEKVTHANLCRPVSYGLLHANKTRFKRLRLRFEALDLRRSPVKLLTAPHEVPFEGLTRTLDKKKVPVEVLHERNGLAIQSSPRIDIAAISTGNGRCQRKVTITKFFRVTVYGGSLCLAGKIVRRKDPFAFRMFSKRKTTGRLCNISDAGS
jgi:hypothetical protein